jgi:hypothetical protein
MFMSPLSKTTRQGTAITGTTKMSPTVSAFRLAASNHAPAVTTLERGRTKDYRRHHRVSRRDTGYEAAKAD